MSYLQYERSIPLVCVVDQETTSLPTYQNVVERQAMQLHFATSVMELRNSVSLDRMAVVVLDLDGEGEQGLSLQRDLLRSEVPAAVILTTSNRCSDVVIESLGLGAIALLPKSWHPDLMAQSLQFAEVQHQHQQRFNAKLGGVRRILSKLTDRQRQVLELAATGMPNKLIATQIDVSQRTVETERSRILEAFDSTSCLNVMVRVGEFRILEQIEQMRKRNVQRQLGMHAASPLQEPCESPIR